MIDAAVARFGWGVLAVAIAATIGVRLATPDCELAAPDQRTVAGFDAAGARFHRELVQRELDAIDRGAARAIAAVARAPRAAERADTALWRLVHELADIDRDLEIVGNAAWRGRLHGERADHLTQIEQIARPMSDSRERGVAIALVIFERDIDSVNRQVAAGEPLVDRFELRLAELRRTRLQLVSAFDHPNVVVSWPSGHR